MQLPFFFFLISATAIIPSRLKCPMPRSFLTNVNRDLCSRWQALEFFESKRRRTCDQALHSKPPVGEAATQKPWVGLGFGEDRRSLERPVIRERNRERLGAPGGTRHSVVETWTARA